MATNFQELDPMIREEIAKEQAKKKAEAIVEGASEVVGEIKKVARGVNNFLKEQVATTLPNPLSEDLRKTIKSPEQEKSE